MIDSDNIDVVLYKNRKFYCSKKRCYMNLSDIYNVFSKGACISIQEHETGKDVTKDVLVKSIINYGINYETKLKMLSKVVGS